MKTMMLIAAIATGLGLAAMAAQAQDLGPRMSFEQMDADADGLLTAEDLAALAAARFAAADSNADGGLSMDEMLARADADAATRAAGRLTRMLAARDADGDGLLQPAEMRPHEGRGIARMLARFDADEDGALSAGEFAAAQAWMAERHDGGRGHGGRDRG